MKKATRIALPLGVSVLLALMTPVSAGAVSVVVGGGGNYPQSPPNANAFTDNTPPGYVNYSTTSAQGTVQDMGYPASALTGAVPNPPNAYTWLAKVSRGNASAQLTAGYSIHPVYVNSKLVALTGGIEVDGKGYPSALGVTNAGSYWVAPTDLGGHAAASSIQSSEAWKWAEYLHGNPYFLFGNPTNSPFGQGGFLYNDALGTISGYRDAYSVTNQAAASLSFSTPDAWQAWDLSAIASGSGASVNTGIGNLHCSDQLAVDKTYTGTYTSECAPLNTSNRADTSSGSFGIGPLVVTTTPNDSVTSATKQGGNLVVHINQQTSDTNHYYAAVLFQSAARTQSLKITNGVSALPVYGKGAAAANIVDSLAAYGNSPGTPISYVQVPTLPNANIATRQAYTTLMTGTQAPGAIWYEMTGNSSPVNNATFNAQLPVNLAPGTYQAYVFIVDGLARPAIGGNHGWGYNVTITVPSSVTPVTVTPGVSTIGKSCLPNGGQSFTVMASASIVSPAQHLEIVNATTGNVVDTGTNGQTSISATQSEPTGKNYVYLARLTSASGPATASAPYVVSNSCTPAPTPLSAPLALILPPYNPVNAQTYPIVRIPMVNEGSYPVYTWSPYQVSYQYSCGYYAYQDVDGDSDDFNHLLSNKSDTDGDATYGYFSQTCTGTRTLHHYVQTATKYNTPQHVKFVPEYPLSDFNLTSSYFPAFITPSLAVQEQWAAGGIAAQEAKIQAYYVHQSFYSAQYCTNNPDTSQSTNPMQGMEQDTANVNADCTNKSVPTAAGSAYLLFNGAPIKTWTLPSDAKQHGPALLSPPTVSHSLGVYVTVGYDNATSGAYGNFPVGISYNSNRYIASVYSGGPQAGTNYYTHSSGSLSATMHISGAYYHRFGY